MSDEFSQRRTIEEFVVWAGERSAQLLGLEKLSEPKQSREDKRIVEEVLPIYFYVRQAYATRQEAQIELNGQGVPDASIWDERGKLLEGIEVTVAFEANDHLARRALVRGMTLAEVFADRARSRGKYFAEIEKVLAKKAQTRHAPHTTLLVLLNSDWIQEPEDFAIFLNHLRARLTSHSFSKIVVMDPTGVFLDVL